MLSQQGVTRERATFDQGAVLRELCQQLPAGADVSAKALLRLTRRIVQQPDVIPVLSSDGAAFTTLDMLAVEQHALSLVARRDRDSVACSPAARVTGPVVRSGLRIDQHRAVLQLLTTGRGVEVVTGPAGSGKTAALRIATNQWTQSGVRVAGTAVAALTAQGLQNATGAPSVSLARLLHQPDQHLPTGGVLLVDEAGMIGTRTLTELLELTEAGNCKLVLVGDPAQLPELEAGGLFASLSQRPEALHLDGHHRQRESWERVALAALRCGEVARAFDCYEQHGRLHTASSRAELHGQAVDRYVGARGQAEDPWQVAILAARRSEVRQLNDLVRTRLMADGRLGQTALQLDTERGQIEYRRGDQALVSRNDHQRELLNGTTAVVDDLGPDSLTLRTTNGRRVTVDRGWLEQGVLDHGYAMTIHKAQGRTVHTTLLVGDAGLGAEAGYVGLSRGTHANHLFLDLANDARDGTDCSANPRWRKPVRERRPLDTALQHSRAQQLAITRLAEGRGR